MLKQILSALLFLSALVAPAETLDLGAHGRFTINVPDEWKFVSQAIEGKGYSAALRPASGLSAGLKITIMYVPQPKPLDEAELKANLLRVCDQFVGSSVEQAKNLKDYGVKRGFGQYAVFTDGSLIGKPEAPGEFKMISPGVVQMTDDVIVILTAVSQDARGKDFAAILAAIRSLEVSPAR